MKFFKKYWAPILAICLIPLLLILAALQLTWIGEMGERERFRLTQGLYAASGQLSAAFVNEIGLLPAIFGHERQEIERNIRTGDWTNFKKRWEVWKSYALDPSFIAGFYIIRPARDKRQTEAFVWDGETFSVEAKTRLIDSLSAAIAYPQKSRAYMEPADLDDGTEALLVPAGWNGDYWLAIRIDRKILAERLIPMLAERYLFGKTDYIFRIVDLKYETTVYISDKNADVSLFNRKDVSIPLIRSDFRSVRGSLQLPPVMPIEDEPGLAIMKTRRKSIDEQEDPDLKSETHGLLPLSHEMDQRARWALEAVHRSGSLADAVRGATIRSAVVSTSILLILSVVLFILADAVRRIQELADRRKEFITTVTHELKTPIAVIRSAAENLADGVVKDPRKTAKYGNVIRRESGKLADMIDSLLVYARVGDGAARRFDAVDMGSIAMMAIESRQDELIAADFAVETELPEGIYVQGDASALELAVGNLISNALKHAADGAYLGVSLRRGEFGNKEYAILSVSDRGPGIPRKERRLVFDPFYRGNVARDRQTPGSGLGLNLVYRIVAAHGGDIALDSKGELGSTFVIRIPSEVRANA